jgi:RimJ/RimL family protein N-acetyltransferase
LDQFQRQGYATEIVRALSNWAFSHDVVKRIAAETEWANPASVRVLEKTVFVSAGQATEQGGASFELLR